MVVQRVRDSDVGGGGCEDRGGEKGKNEEHSDVEGGRGRRKSRPATSEEKQGRAMSGRAFKHLYRSQGAASYNGGSEGDGGDGGGDG